MFRRLSRSQRKLNRTFSQETIAEEDEDEGGFRSGTSSETKNNLDGKYSKIYNHIQTTPMSVESVICLIEV
ncbi:hypothetical protein GWI33_012479 [Rhynchophorus ferrugineus]|uniref:Uncharacterized protein n=1 Tax=Rhynchophorus ferrugineus TaxID=354439 RepID=A0A834I882_RHYFE|nr:hypothetical protein GWI33_012479 [Rhynchophorus ferrugineus]